MKNSSSVPGHADAIDFYLRLEAVWDFFKTCTIAECEDCWIIGGRIFKKEVTKWATQFQGVLTLIQEKKRQKKNMMNPKRKNQSVALEVHPVNLLQ